MSIDYQGLRREYTKAGLLEREMSDDPIYQFSVWFEEATRLELLDSEAMTLATCGEDGQPEARTVLLKGCDKLGFVFYTNYHSRKARQIAENPKGCLMFYWRELERQIRIVGTMEKIDRAHSEAYFATRPKGSQLSAWASPQSDVVTDRAALESRLADLEKEYAENKVPCPEHWGGYRLKPSSIEFWQGRVNRLHDRIRYRLDGESWVIERLAP